MEPSAAIFTKSILIWLQERKKKLLLVAAKQMGVCSPLLFTTLRRARSDYVLPLEILRVAEPTLSNKRVHSIVCYSVRRIAVCTLMKLGDFVLSIPTNFRKRRNSIRPQHSLDDNFVGRFGEV